MVSHIKGMKGMTVGQLLFAGVGAVLVVLIALIFVVGVADAADPVQVCQYGPGHEVYDADGTIGSVRCAATCLTDWTTCTAHGYSPAQDATSSCFDAYHQAALAALLPVLPPPTPPPLLPQCGDGQCNGTCSILPVTPTKGRPDYLMR